MATITTRAGKGSPLTNSELDANFTNLNSDKIELTDLSVGSEGTASGDGSITYSNSTGVFTYTPPDLSVYQTTAGFDEAVDDRVNTLLQAGLGIDLDYDDINGELTIDSNHIEIACTNNSGASIPVGTPVYQTGVSGNNITIAPADADDSAKMPAIGITTTAIADTASGTITILGVVNGLDTSSYTAGATLYISTTAGGLTTTAPAGETSLIQNFARVLKVNASSGSIAVMGAGRSNAVPNLADGKVFIGNASNQAEQRVLLEADISDFGTYLTTETNDLTASVTWANVPDANITQSSVTQHQSALSITESQISDLQSYLTSVSVDGLSDATITTPADNELLAYDSTSSEWINQTPTEAGFATVATSGAYSDLSGTPTNVSAFTNDSGYLTSFTETNDLTVSVTWANVPDANITQSSVTQHQSALSITESQISDLGTYLTDAPSDGNQYARQNGGWSTITAGASLDDATALAIALG